MSKQLLQRIKSLKPYIQFYISQDIDLQKDILENKMTDEEIEREVDFELENMKKKKKPITFRMNEYDVFSLKQKAYEQGVPYQTLLHSFLHQQLQR